MLQKVSHEREVPLCGRQVECRAVVVVGGAHVGSGANQRLDFLQIARGSGIQKAGDQSVGSYWKQQ